MASDALVDPASLVIVIHQGIPIGVLTDRKDGIPLTCILTHRAADSTPTESPQDFITVAMNGHGPLPKTPEEFQASIDRMVTDYNDRIEALAQGLILHVVSDAVREQRAAAPFDSVQTDIRRMTLGSPHET